MNSIDRLEPEPEKEIFELGITVWFDEFRVKVKLLEGDSASFTVKPIEVEDAVKTVMFGIFEMVGGVLVGLITVTVTPPGYGFSSESLEETSNRRELVPDGAAAKSTETVTVREAPGATSNGAVGVHEIQDADELGEIAVTLRVALPSFEMMKFSPAGICDRNIPHQVLHLFAGDEAYSCTVQNEESSTGSIIVAL